MTAAAAQNALALCTLNLREGRCGLMAPYGFESLAFELGNLFVASGSVERQEKVLGRTLHCTCDFCPELVGPSLSWEQAVS
jgi:hypothetical protein